MNQTHFIVKIQPSRHNKFKIKSLFAQKTAADQTLGQRLWTSNNREPKRPLPESRRDSTTTKTYLMQVSMRVVHSLIIEWVMKTVSFCFSLKMKKRACWKLKRKSRGEKYKCEKYRKRRYRNKRPFRLRELLVPFHVYLHFKTTRQDPKSKSLSFGSIARQILWSTWHELD